MLKPTWETFNLNISASVKNLKKNWYTIFLGGNYLIQWTNYFLSSIKTQGGDVSGRHP